MKFEDLGQAFESWLKVHASEYIDDKATPDLWTTFHEHPHDVEPDLGYDTEPFEAAEKEQLRMAVNDFRATLHRQLDPSGEEAASINARLDYLSDSLDRLNRIDWRGLAVSTVMSISVALTLDTERCRQLMSLFKQVFQSVTLLMK